MDSKQGEVKRTLDYCRAQYQALESHMERIQLESDHLETFGSQGPIRWTAGEQQDFIAVAAKKKFFACLLDGLPPLEARDAAVSLLLVSNGNHNDRNAKYFSNQVFARTGESCVMGCFYMVRDMARREGLDGLLQSILEEVTP